MSLCPEEHPHVLGTFVPAPSDQPSSLFQRITSSCRTGTIANGESRRCAPARPTCAGRPFTALASTEKAARSTKAAEGRAGVSLQEVAGTGCPLHHHACGSCRIQATLQR